MLKVLRRLELSMARGLMRLPPGWQVRLSGKPALEVEGERLAPDVQLLLSLLARRGITSFKQDGVEVLRRRLHDDAVASAGRHPAVGATRDLEIPGAAGPLRARLYTPAVQDGTGTPLLVYFHGGGMAAGDLETHDGLCRHLCAGAGLRVLSAEYRLAPEHRFPAASDDALAVMKWAHSQAQALGADPRRVGVGGDSAGGSLAAAVSLVSRGESWAPAFQLLFYPATGRREAWRSLDLFADGLFLTRADIDWFGMQYARTLEDLADPRFSPLFARDLKGLPPALVVTAAFDPLRDEGEAYARAMSDAGNSVTLKRMPGVVHGFANMTDVSPTCRAAVREVVEELRARVDAVGSGRQKERGAA
jgi:acetyl esterase